MRSDGAAAGVGDENGNGHRSGGVTACASIRQEVMSGPNSNQKRRFLKAADDVSRKLQMLRFEAMNFSDVQGLQAMHVEIKTMIDTIEKHAEMVQAVVVKAEGIYASDKEKV
jgi:hypothetical protein